MKKLLLSLIAVGISGASLLLSTAHAATITVENTNDSGAGSLRQALIDANPGDTITFDLGAGPHTITLTSQLAINKGVVINGPLTSSLTVSGGGVTRVFTVTAGTVELANFTVTRAENGGLEAQGASTVVTVRNMLFTGNHVYGSGGAMRVTGGATLNVDNSTISGNTGTHGAGFYNGSGILNLRSVTVTNNYANGDPGNGGGACFYAGEGGAIDNSTNSAVTIANSILAGNTACNTSLPNISGPFTDLGYNIVSGDPLLQPLADNGGPTRSHDPQPGSPAIDQGKAFGLTTDERGLTRPARYDARITPPTGGDFSDIGAVELATPVCTPPPGNMVSWWPGDGNAHDIQSQNNGTLEGGATFAAGEVGQAFSFNGSNQDVFIGNPANLNPTSLTIDAWINPNTVPSPSDVLLGIVTKWAESTAGDNYAIWTYVTGTGSTTVVRLYTSLVDSLGNYHTLAGGIVPLNTFSHVAMTYDSATGYQALYVNGVLVSSATGGAKPIRTTNANVYIGSEPAAGGRYFSGLIDEVEILNTALSQTDIQAIYNASYQGKCRSCTPPPPDMVAWWPGDGHANDIQGGNHGTIVGAVTYATGKVGQAFDLGGVTNQGLVSFGNQPALQLTTAITVDAWISPDTTTGNYQTVASKWAQGNSSWGLFIVNSTAYGIITKTDGNLIQIGGGVVPVGTGELTHVAMTYSNADGLRLYVNGSQVSAGGVGGGSIRSSSNNVQIGNDQDQVPDRWFDGRIDEVEIFDRALTATEIAAIADADNAGKCKPPAVITTQASSTTAIGGTISDTATLSAGNNPTGTITFNLYGPNNANCGGTPVFTSTVTATGDGAYNSGNFTPTTAGTYRWIATYNGDANNIRVATACNDANESVVVSQASPTITTTASASVVVGGTISDSATLSGGYNPTGSIVFYVFGPDDATCGNAAVFVSAVTVNAGNGTYTSDNFTPTTAGTYRWIASYGGDANNNLVLLPCNDTNESVLVSKATPTITWSNPADIVYGTALGSSQLNATASVAGSFNYTPAAGTVFNAGASQTLSVSFTPTDTTNYNNTSKNVLINVLKATPTITWSNPADITYGTALSSTQLNATASVAGTLTYNPVSGTVLNGGNNQTLSVSFAPSDTANYDNALKNVSINVLRATPTITWSNPADITYGTALSSTQLNATASVAGSFTYTPSAGTVLNAGANQDLAVFFEASDATNYNNAAKNVSINVLKATPTVTWSNPADITYGTALSGTQLNASASVAGAFSYTPPAGTVLNAGANQNLSTAFTPTDTTNYNNAAKTVTINVLKATPVITWSNPADIIFGTALSGTQLNATTPVAGSFSYTPPSGTVLNVGNAQTLSTTFTPTDTANYNNAAKNVSITVNPLPVAPKITSAKSATFRVNMPGTFTVTTTGTPKPAVTEAGALPNGVTFTDNHDGTATIAGTPTTKKSFSLTITADNGTPPNATQKFKLKVAK